MEELQRQLEEVKALDELELYDWLLTVKAGLMS